MLFAFLLKEKHKQEYLIYIETVGLENNIYSELNIDSINISNYNILTSNIINLNNKIHNIKINTIINNFNIPIQYLDNNMYNEYNSLLLTLYCIRFPNLEPNISKCL